jgi:hypothetical protein
MTRIFRVLKPGDYAIIFGSLCVILLLFYRSFSSSSSGLYVEITGESFRASCDPKEERVVEVEGPLGITRVIIGEGGAWIEDSPCRDKLCVKMGKIKREGEQLICLPNRVVVEMKGSKELIDSISR